MGRCNFSSALNQGRNKNLISARQICGNIPHIFQYHRRTAGLQQRATTAQGSKENRQRKRREKQKNSNEHFLDLVEQYRIRLAELQAQIQSLED